MLQEMGNEFCFMKNIIKSSSYLYAQEKAINSCKYGCFFISEV